MSRPASPETLNERVNQLGADYRQKLIENMANELGRPSNGTEIKPDKELALWLQPTSPAAQVAMKRGATPDEVEQANAMWAAEMRNQGYPPEQILQACRKYAFERGKVHGQGDPKKTVEWHEQMAQKANARRNLRLVQSVPADGALPMAA